MKHIALSEGFENIIYSLNNNSNKIEPLERFFHLYFKTLTETNLKSSELSQATLSLKERYDLVRIDLFLRQFATNIDRTQKMVDYLEENAVDIVKIVSQKTMDYLAKLDIMEDFYAKNSKYSDEEVVDIYKCQEFGFAVKSDKKWAIDLVYSPKNKEGFGLSGDITLQGEPHAFWTIVNSEIKSGLFEQSDLNLSIGKWLVTETDEAELINKKVSVIDNAVFFENFVPKHIAEGINNLQKEMVYEFSQKEQTVDADTHLEVL